ncbi:MAG: helix-turn-helix domain-containing protein [Myxococcaceae bacterium]
MSTFLVGTPAQLGSILRGFRQQRGLTQSELAAQLGLAQKTISLAETSPERLTISRLLELLGALNAELTVRDREVRKPSTGEW